MFDGKWGIHVPGDDGSAGPMGNNSGGRNGDKKGGCTPWLVMMIVGVIVLAVLFAGVLR